jgi:hypothetical protein
MIKFLYLYFLYFLLVQSFPLFSNSKSKNTSSRPQTYEIKEIETITFDEFFEKYSHLFNNLDTNEFQIKRNLENQKKEFKGKAFFILSNPFEVSDWDRYKEKTINDQDYVLNLGIYDFEKKKYTINLTNKSIIGNPTEYTSNSEFTKDNYYTFVFDKIKLKNYISPDYLYASPGEYNFFVDESLAEEIKENYSDVIYGFLLIPIEHQVELTEQNYKIDWNNLYLKNSYVTYKEVKLTLGKIWLSYKGKAYELTPNHPDKEVDLKPKYNGLLLKGNINSVIKSIEESTKVELESNTLEETNDTE